MPLRKLVLRPGINRQLSPTLEEGGWTDGNLVRFPYGSPQPIGGWLRFSQTLVTGVARALLAWTQLDHTQNVAVATHLKLQMFQGGALFDLTPMRVVLTVAAGEMTTIAGSAVVTINAPNHGCSAGDFIEIPTPVTIGGLTLYGEYTVAQSGTTAAFTFSAAAAAASSASSTAPVVVGALLPVGSADATQGNGWGAGPWGAGTFGTARGAMVTEGVVRLWSLDHWGEELLACVRGGGIYNWKPSGGTTVRAALLSGAPTAALVILVGMPERHLIAFGCTSPVSGVFDPLLICWSDVENYSTWIATATNSAGSFRLATGNSILGALAVSQEILVFTESNVVAMRFVGLPYVYNFTQLEGEHTGLIAANAAVTAGNGLVFWMGLACFWTYAGAAQPLPCDVWDAVFGNLNRQQADKITSGSNAAYGEVWWFYPSAAATENDSVVTYNYVTRIWSLGGMARTAWIDVGVLQRPLATDPTGVVFSHELGTDADGQALPAWVSTGFIDLEDGEEIGFVRELIPDFSAQAGSVAVTVAAKRFPDDPAPTSKGPFTLTAATRFISPRLRGRQFAITLASVGTGAFWRLGAMRARLAGSGRQ